MKIGFIGLGSMGSVMAKRLAQNGDVVIGHDIDAAAAERAKGSGVILASSLAEIAESCELVVSMVWDDRALRTVTTAADGLFMHGAFRGCMLDLSTTSDTVAHEVARQAAKGGATFLDGSVIGGGVPAARQGRSPILVSGDLHAFHRYRTVLERMGQCDYVGDTGAAKTAKIINNFIVGVMTAANSEVLSLGEAAGLDLARMVELLQDGPGGTHVMRSYMGRYVAEGKYGDGLIGHALMAKDVSLACELDERTGTRGLFAEMTQQAYLTFARAMGRDAAFPSSFDYHRRYTRGAPAS